MSNGSTSSSTSSGGGGSVAIVAIVAILLLVGVAAWFIWGRPSGTRVVHHSGATTSQSTGHDSL